MENLLIDMLLILKKEEPELSELLMEWCEYYIIKDNEQLQEFILDIADIVKNVEIDQSE